MRFADPVVRDSPDESQTGINVRVFPALLQDRREVLTATNTSGNPNAWSRVVQTMGWRRPFFADLDPPQTFALRADKILGNERQIVWRWRASVVSDLQLDLACGPRNMLQTCRVGLRDPTGYGTKGVPHA